MKRRVVVAMSGGVDSSVAAGILLKKGYEVIGITMCFGLKEVNKKRPSCCGIEGIEDARRVAHTLGIKHYVLNFDKVLQKKVIEDFIFEYLSGRTPNPCIRCNQYLKFEQLLGKAKNLGAEYLATGHYAKIVASHPSALLRAGKSQATGKIFLLKKAKDKYKDQSYFLYRLTQKQLAHILFPLGNYTKFEVRQLASEFNLSVKDKPGSQEICFIPDDDYREFLKRELTRINPVRNYRAIRKEKEVSNGVNANVKPGPILDLNGKIVGEHKGIPFYTIGQREGLGIARGYPIYIIKIDAKNNTIIVGKREEVFSSGLIAGKVSFTAKAIKREVALKVKIRYNHPEVLSKVSLMGKDTLKAIFSKPQFAVTPGQSAVFYKGNIVVGGGIIESGLKDAEVSR